MKKRKEYILSKYVEKVFETSGEYPEWGGYYNYDFLSADASKLLCNRSSMDARAVEKGDIVEVGYYDFCSGIWNKLDESDSFNWPQATMLQWIPGTEDKEVIFNLSKDGHLISRIINIETGEKRDMRYPVYCVTPDGKQAITLNLERSYWTPAYHYQSVVNEECNVDVLEGDGIFSLDLDTNTVRQIVSLDDVLKIKPEERFSEGKHWLEHIMISPSGEKFVFLHRYMYEDSARLTRIFIADIDGSNLKIIDNWQKYIWSHFGWKTDDSFVIYTREENNFSKAYNGKTIAQQKSGLSFKSKIYSLIKFVYKKFFSGFLPSNFKQRLANKMGYQMYELAENGEYVLKETYSDDLLNIDGHPSFEKTGRYMITDSYADDKKYRRLTVWDTEKKKGILVGSFYSPFWGTPASCDLHPKLSRDGSHIVIDTACSGMHRMMVFKLNWNKLKK